MLLLVLEDVHILLATAAFAAATASIGKLGDISLAAVGFGYWGLLEPQFYLPIKSQPNMEAMK